MNLVNHAVTQKILKQRAYRQNIERVHSHQLLNYTMQQIPEHTSFVIEEMYKVRKKLTEINTKQYLALRTAQQNIRQMNLKFYRRPFQI